MNGPKSLALWYNSQIKYDFMFDVNEVKLKREPVTFSVIYIKPAPYLTLEQCVSDIFNLISI